MRVVPLEALKRTSIAKGFLFFIFYFEYLIRIQVLSRFMQKWIQPCLFGSLFAWAQTAIFSTESCSKMQARHQLFFGLQLVSKEFWHPAIQTKIVQHFCWFFHQIKVRQPIGRQDSIQTVIRTRRRLDSFLHEEAQNFEVFSNIQEWK